MADSACSYPLLAWKRVAIFGFALNVVWEFVQCLVLYDMWQWPFWRATVAMWAAVFGDVVVVLCVVFLASRFTPLDPPRLRVWVTLVGVGLPLSIILEWIPRRLDWWSYSSHMPTIHVFGHEVGLSPIVQITLLPALSVYLASRRRRPMLA